MAPKKFEESEYYDPLKCKKLLLPFGKFYLFDNYFVSEISESVHLDSDKIQQLILKLVEHYGEDSVIGNVSNRVHSYSIDANEWFEILNYSDFIIAFAIVVNNHFDFINATIEKGLSKNSLKRCNDLDEAIKWVNNLRELAK